MALLDLTDLGEAATVDGARALCVKARSGSVAVAAVCLWPRFVATAREELAGSAVKIATVVNFPAGGADIEAVVAETRAALAAGADEIDLVLPWRAFLAGDAVSPRAMVEAVRAACGAATLKIILETGEYPDLARVREASDLAIAAGADFIKTSTGKTARSASLDAAGLMLEAIKAAPRPVGLKPSGGIRTLADAQDYLALADRAMGPGWATPASFRFGASGLYDVLAAELAGGTAAPATGPY